MISASSSLANSTAHVSAWAACSEPSMPTTTRLVGCLVVIAHAPFALIQFRSRASVHDPDTTRGNRTFWSGAFGDWRQRNFEQTQGVGTSEVPTPRANWSQGGDRLPRLHAKSYEPGHSHHGQASDPTGARRCGRSSKCEQPRGEGGGTPNTTTIHSTSFDGVAMNAATKPDSATLRVGPPVSNGHDCGAKACGGPRAFQA